MTSSWAINNGVARNSDLKLVGPLIRVTGAGAVKLGERSIDYTLKTKIVADARGQGGPIDIGGLEVPIKITGPWEKPKFAPDVGGVLKDPDKAVETIKQIGKQFKSKDAKELLRGILGGGGQSAPQQ
jgi:AsmA protein